MSHEPCRVAVITGGARGIGYATADVLARDGHAVVIADIDPGAGEDAAERLRAAGRSALSVPTDVADRASVEAMVRTLLERLGRIDVLVHNAGIAGRVAPLHEVTEQEWDTLIGIDLKSVYLCCRAVLPHMLERQRGAIINVASVAGKEGNPNMAPRSEEHTSELQSQSNLVCRLLLAKKKYKCTGFPRSEY